MKKALLVLLVSVFVLQGCMATYGGAQYDRTAGEIAYYEMLKEMAAQPHRPLFELVAREGEPITGIERITVNAPQDQMNIAQYSRPTSEWAPVVQGVLSTALPMALGMWGTYEITKAATGAVAGVARNPTIVEQPAPTIVTQPDPTVITQPPVQVVEPPPPVIVDRPDPIIVTPPDPIIVDQPVFQQ